MASEDDFALANLSALESSLPSVNSDSHFMRLPLEIRDQIYEEVFTERKERWSFPKSHCSTWPRIHLGLLTTSKQIKAEADKVFYSLRLFVFRLYNLSPTSVSFTGDLEGPIVAMSLPWPLIEEVIFDARFKPCTNCMYEK